MSTEPRMKTPWSVVGAGFNDDGVCFTFDDTVISGADIKLMQAAPDLLEALKLMVDAQLLPEYHHGIARAAISKATGE